MAQIISPAVCWLNPSYHLATARLGTQAPRPLQWQVLQWPSKRVNILLWSAIKKRLTELKMCATARLESVGMEPISTSGAMI